MICPVCGKEFNEKPSRLKRLKRAKEVCCSVECSDKLRKEYYLGELNPNSKYIYDRNLFENINAEEKAYILGFIAADSSINNGSIDIFVNKKDIDIIEKIKNYICPQYTIIPKEKNLCGIMISSKKIIQDVCYHLQINTGKKAGNNCNNLPSFPNINDNLKIHFIRGFYDGDGSIRKCDGTRTRPDCSISNTSYKLLEDISNVINIKLFLKEDKLNFEGINALDFLSKIYDKATIYLNRKYKIYCQWSRWVPGLQGQYKNLITFKSVKIYKNAILPFKNRASNCGYDLTFIRKIKEDRNIHWFGTGIKINPEYGWYVDIVPRSSISKWGYMLTNSVGIIDRGYLGEIIAPMIKIDKTKPDPKLPVRILQAIPRQIFHVKFEEVDSFDDKTERGELGFGSTGK